MDGPEQSLHMQAHACRVGDQIPFMSPLAATSCFVSWQVDMSLILFALPYQCVKHAVHSESSRIAFCGNSTQNVFLFSVVQFNQTKSDEELRWAVLNVIEMLRRHKNVLETLTEAM